MSKRVRGWSKEGIIALMAANLVWALLSIVIYEPSLFEETAGRIICFSWLASWLLTNLFIVDGFFLVNRPFLMGFLLKTTWRGIVAGFGFGLFRISITYPEHTLRWFIITALLFVFGSLSFLDIAWTLVKQGCSWGMWLCRVLTRISQLKDSGVPTANYVAKKVSLALRGIAWEVIECLW